MATTAEIKELKRAELDALAVEQGLDPATFSKAEDLRAELLKSADDADEQGNEGDEGDATGDGSDAENTTTGSAENVPENAADKAADAAEVPTVREAVGSSHHANKFDKYGNPVFGE